MKEKYIISVHGCDDTTSIIKELNVNELKIIVSVAKEITETSTYPCMPIMEIIKYKGE